MLEVCLLGTSGMMPLPRRALTALMTRYNGQRAGAFIRLIRFVLLIFTETTSAGCLGCFFRWEMQRERTR